MARKKRNKKRSEKEDKNKVVALLEEILRWIKVTSIPHVKELLDSLSPEEKIVYQHSDGGSSREVAKAVNVHFTTVVHWWKKWYTLGIVEAIPVKRGVRYCRVFSLEDFDIKVPKIEEVRHESSKEENASDK